MSRSITIRVSKEFKELLRERKKSYKFGTSYANVTKDIAKELRKLKIGR